MAGSNGNSSMNITQKTGGVGKCDEKCSYSYKYQTSSNCNAGNHNTNISFSYEQQQNPAVYFNKISYQVDTVEFYSPSIHKFDGKKVDAEIVIRHLSNSGSPLLVCIPMTPSGTISEGSKMITQMLEEVSNRQLHNGDSSMSVTVDDYNLDKIIPRKPFFYYENNNKNYIVYGRQDSLNLNADLMNKINELLALPQNILAPETSILAFNENGPSPYGISGMDDEIYIDCQPTGNSQENMDVKFNEPANPSVNNLGDLINSPLVKIVLLTITIVLLIYMFFRLDNYIAKK